jgi:hypothetical protein
MNDRRRKFIGEIAGLAKLVAGLPAPFQSHMLDLAGEMATDAKCFEDHRRLYEDQPRPVREAAGRVRSGELGDFMASGPFFQSLCQVLGPLADEAPGQLDGILYILCGEIVHRRAWDETIKRNPQTLDFFKNNID